MKKVLMIVVPILVVGIGVGIWLALYNTKVIVKLKTELEVDIYADVMEQSFVDSVKKGSIVSSDKKLDTESLGRKKIVIDLKNDYGKKTHYTYFVNVVDKEAPVITYKDALECFVGEKIDLYKDVSVSDNSKEEIKVSVSGDYDLEKAGVYNLTYVARDSSRNTAKEKFTLTVKEKPKDTKPTPVTTTTNTTFTTSKGYNGEVKNGLTYIDGVLIANKTYSLPSNYGNGLTSTTQSAFTQMKEAAKAEGLNIYISSGFRSYSTQQTLYNNYVKRDGKAEADTYSARAGHSEHQTGLAFDVNKIDSSFAKTKEAKWLASNCHKYGFILRYPKGKEHLTGYIYEPWHFRYVGTDLANRLYNDGDWLTLEEYFGITSKYN